jgi:hypothetical protein
MLYLRLSATRGMPVIYTDTRRITDHLLHGFGGGFCQFLPDSKNKKPTAKNQTDMATAANYRQKNGEKNGLKPGKPEKAFFA